MCIYIMYLYNQNN